MAREIRFKAWDKQSKKILFVTGIKGVVDLRKNSTEIYEVVCAERMNDVWKSGGCHEIDNIELMQFTDITDKNGKEIYENDLLLIDGKIFIVKFFNGGFCLFQSNDDSAWKHEDWQDLRSYAWSSEVYGNLFETPELLGGKS